LKIGEEGVMVSVNPGCGGEPSSIYGRVRERKEKEG
jgi:hypothetical protein